MRIIRVLKTETREGFRLLVAFVAGVLSFGLLSRFSESILSSLDPWVRQSDTDLVLLLLLIGVGASALGGAVALEALTRWRNLD